MGFWPRKVISSPEVGSGQVPRRLMHGVGPLNPLGKAIGMIVLKRVYEPVSPDDGFRILVERLWPRGISKQIAQIDLWLKDVAPSPKLRKWYQHDVLKWVEFQQRYQAELSNNQTLSQLQSLVRENETVTFVYSARDEEHNSARVLKDYLENLP